MATFRKIKRIGSGGFGEVWRGVRTANNEEVAIKYLSDGSADSVHRFQREVRCLESLSHPNIVRLLGKRLNEEPYFYVMPLYETSLFNQFPQIVGETERIRTIFGAVLQAVRHAHSDGVIHRDLKPENVLMNGDGEVVVSDFGLGKNVNSESSRVTTTGRALGTWWYCAPEQLMDAKRADERSDIFSLGRMLYDLYAGLNVGTQDLSAVPIVIASVIEKATSRNPDARYQSIDEMIKAFDSAAEVLLGEFEAGSIEAIIEDLKRPGDGLDEHVARFTNAIANHACEGDVVHDALMQMPENAFRALVKRDLTLARRLIRTFSEFVRSQSWGFSYTDKIAAAARTLFRASQDSEIRSQLLLALLVVGVDHNRWGVMETFAALLQEARSDTEAQAFWDALHNQTPELDRVRDYVSLTKIHPTLRRLFPSVAAEGTARTTSA